MTSPHPHPFAFATKGVALSDADLDHSTAASLAAASATVAAAAMAALPDPTSIVLGPDGTPPSLPLPGVIEAGLPEGIVSETPPSGHGSQDELVSIESPRSTSSHKARKGRRSLTLMDKLEVVWLADEGFTQQDIASLYEIDRSTVSKVLKLRHELEARYASLNFNPNVRTQKKSPYDRLEEAILEWIQDLYNQAGQKIPLTSHAIKEKARELAKQAEVYDFKASNGWYERFKIRHDLGRFVGKSPLPVRPMTKQE